MKRRLELVGMVVLLTAAGSIASASAQSGGSGYDDSGNGSYPRVTQLEKQVFGTSYVNEPLVSRLNRLETKQFGKPSTGDFSDRVDKLDDVIKPASLAPKGYVNDDIYDNPPAGATGAAPSAASGGGTPVASSDDSGDVGNYPRVNELERQFLGQTYATEPLQTRLARLETKRFNKTYPDEALVDRIDRLDKGAEKKNALAVDNQFDDNGQQRSDSDSQSGSKKGGFGSMLGKALLGLAGVQTGPASGGSTVNGPNAVGLGGGMGGLGLGGAPGMVPYLRVRQRQAGPQNGDQADEPRTAAVPNNPFSPDAEPVSGVENRTGVLEKFVFGKEHIEKPMEARVELLEKRLVPYEHNNTGKDIATRVNHLWTILSAANRQPTKRAGEEL